MLLHGSVSDGIFCWFMGFGQAGTQFWDESLDRELRQDRLTGATLDMSFSLELDNFWSRAL
jgi:hypothetical protein